MKSAITIFFALFSLSSMAAICDNSRLHWDNDQILEQFECQNAKTKLCSTKAIFGGDNNEYVVVSGQVDTDYGHPSVYVMVWYENDKEGRISEDRSFMELVYAPVPAIIIDNYKFRYEFILNKETGVASYTEESKKVLSFSGWKTSVSEKLVCKLIK
ncbi:MAG: hypothetical protein NDI69_17730 [Bacteriovoracaceae bacterium]|nr:hypothetical protein [Bacteriovoracaceae bacterium]